MLVVPVFIWIPVKTCIFLGSLAHGNILTQCVLKCEINILAIYQRQLLSVAKRVDSGSNTQKNLQKRAIRIQEKIDGRMHSLFRPFDIQNGFGIHHVAKSAITGTCFLMALPVKGAKTALSDFMKHQKDVNTSLSVQFSIRYFLRHITSGERQIQALGGIERQIIGRCHFPGYKFWRINKPWNP